MPFTEDSRVKIPAILHLMRLGYEYLSLKSQTWDTNNNIFKKIFFDSVKRINEGLIDDGAERIYKEIEMCLENEDLGKVFYEKLVEGSGSKLIDFENFDNNSFHVVTELPYQKGDESFRPDIILLINGMPLVFIEVKKPNNLDGIQAERNRMIERFQKKKFRTFVNITQLMIYSNNMKYADDVIQPFQGAFYASSSYHKPTFNYFREPEGFNFEILPRKLSDEEENFVLKDTNSVPIKHEDHFKTNKSPNTPTHKICTSLLSRERLKFLLLYGIAYVKETDGLQKHIMRYPQIFGSMAITRKLDEGIRNGIIWHTQGSGKTALAYFNVKFLTDYYKNRGVVPKFYFIVDRLDLLIQASREFKARGLRVYEIDSRDAFAAEIKSSEAIHNDAGDPEITVVNIQRFQDDPNVARNKDYNINIQRVYFLDEVHRSYNPEGSFLANLRESDPNSIKIGLTGTPLLGKEYNSRTLFGDYIHKYYYNSSIKDGYTLRLIREDIESSYRMKLTEILDSHFLKGAADRKKVFAHHSFVEPMLEYIVKDLEQKRKANSEPTIGGMVVCDSSEQAKMMMELFCEQYVDSPMEEDAYPVQVHPPQTDKKKSPKEKHKVNSAALILHDIGTKKERDDAVTDYKYGKIDLLFVYNMLLTGFNAKRLKKLYIGRVIKSHNLLQTLTRVNRPYKNFDYGYVVDFADIRTEFDKTNKAYFDELQSELGDEMEHYSNLFKSQEEIEEEILEIKETLFSFDTMNPAEFSRQINEINDRKKMLAIVKALNNARSLYNLIRMSGHYDLLEKLDFRLLGKLGREANNRLIFINQKESLEQGLGNKNLLNLALEDIIFAFTKVDEAELKLADELKSILQRTRETLAGNLDPKDPEFISLKEELERLFRKKNLSEVTKAEMEANIAALEKIYDLAKHLERKDARLLAKYNHDAKYMRTHKRLMEKDKLTDREMKIFDLLNGLKVAIEEELLKNSNVLANETYAEKKMGRLIVTEFRKHPQIPLTPDNINRVKRWIMYEYMNNNEGRIA